jgi:hypothetical protein
VGDGVADGDWIADPATNVLIANNTIRGMYRCGVSLTGAIDRVAATNNVIEWSSGHNSAIAFAPYEPRASITHAEVAYNRVNSTKLSEYSSTTMLISAYHDPSPGGALSVHHNYGSWPDPDGFVSTQPYMNGDPAWTLPLDFCCNEKGTPPWAP